RRHGEMNWVVRIQRTLEEDRFRLFSQQIQPLSPKAPPGLYFEVLLRMAEDDGRIHLPSDFLRAAERYGLMRAIDRWVIRNAVPTLRDQPAPFLDLLPPCRISRLPSSTCGSSARSTCRRCRWETMGSSSSSRLSSPGRGCRRPSSAS